jgi:hypothetical protein
VTQSLLEVGKSNLFISQNTINQAMVKDLDGGGIGTEVQFD